MAPVILKIIAGVLGSLGFSIIFRLKPSHWIYAMIDGFVGVVIYFFCDFKFESIFLPNVLAALCCAYLAEIFARKCKAPATVFLLPGCISLVPGSSLYYTMENLLHQNYTAAGDYLLTTAVVAAAIGGGIILASILKIITFKAWDTIQSKLKKVTKIKK